MAAQATLDPRQRLILGACALVGVAAGFAAGRILLVPAHPVTQPIQFDHQKHVKGAGAPCQTCHQFYETSEHSGLPSAAVCEVCHSEALTTSREELTLLQTIAEKKPLEFKKLFRLPDDVYYSHQRHVVAAELTCDTCHGDIAETTAPPPTPLKRITMTMCVDCHTERGVATDCTRCHR